MLPKPRGSHEITLLVTLAILLGAGVLADPETVEGLYLTKKSGAFSPLQSGGQLNHGLAGQNGLAAAEAKPDPVKARQFHQASFGGNTRPGSHRRAFAKYLNDPARNQPYRPPQPQVNQPQIQRQVLQQPQTRPQTQVRPPQPQAQQARPQWLNGAKFYAQNQLPLSQLHQVSHQQQQQARQHQQPMLPQRVLTPRTLYQPPQRHQIQQPLQARFFPGQSQLWNANGPAARSFPDQRVTESQIIKWTEFTKAPETWTTVPQVSGEPLPKPARVVSKSTITEKPKPVEQKPLEVSPSTTMAPPQVRLPDPKESAVNLNKADEKTANKDGDKPSVAKKSSLDDSPSSSKNANNVPRSSFLKEGETAASDVTSASAAENKVDFVGQDRHKAILGLVIGVAFVAVFVAMAVGLAASSVADRVKIMRSNNVFSNIRTPNGDDATPPELRGSGAPTFVQPGGRGGQLGDVDGHLVNSKSGSGQPMMTNGKPFFSGKLILHHDPPGLTTSALCKTTTAAASAAASRMTNSLFAAQQSVMMPSPAEQVTDDLISPKYDGISDDLSEDEDDSDDTVYECPGLAATATAMGDMVVKNPFYLQGDLDLDLGLGGVGSGRGAVATSGMSAASAADPQPISSQSSIFHHGIKGVN